ncbi:MAG: hypothetical protein ACYC42_06755, partial [Lysobacter sp.]
MARRDVARRRDRAGFTTTAPGERPRAARLDQPAWIMVWTRSVVGDAKGVAALFTARGRCA